MEFDHEHKHIEIVPEEKPGLIAWTGTIITLGSYFVLMLAVAYIPDTLARPLNLNGPISIGLLGGVAVLTILVMSSLAFTLWRNRER